MESVYMFIKCMTFSTLTTKKHRVCVKPQTPRILPPLDRAPGFDIPGSATVINSSTFVYFILSGFFNSQFLKYKQNMVYVLSPFARKWSNVAPV